MFAKRKTGKTDANGAVDGRRSTKSGGLLAAAFKAVERWEATAFSPGTKVGPNSTMPKNSGALKKKATNNPLFAYGREDGPGMFEGTMLQVVPLNDSNTKNHSGIDETVWSDTKKLFVSLKSTKNTAGGLKSKTSKSSVGSADESKTKPADTKKKTEDTKKKPVDAKKKPDKSKKKPDETKKKSDDTKKQANASNKTKKKTKTKVANIKTDTEKMKHIAPVAPVAPIKKDNASKHPKKIKNKSEDDGNRQKAKKGATRTVKHSTDINSLPLESLVRWAMNGSGTEDELFKMMRKRYDEEANDHVHMVSENE